MSTLPRKPKFEQLQGRQRSNTVGSRSASMPEARGSATAKRTVGGKFRLQVSAILECYFKVFFVGKELKMWFVLCFS